MNEVFKTFQFPADHIPRLGGDTNFTRLGTHAQNYHLFTPASDKDWCMV